MNHPSPVTLATLPLVLLIAATSTRAAAPVQEPAVVVETAIATIARVEPRRWAPGDVVSRNDARLATSAAGRLEYVAEVGVRVREGERIAKLEDAALRLRIEDTQAEIARIDSQRTQSARQLSRIEQLANNSISLTQLDEVRAQLAMLSAQLEQAKVRHRAALHDLDQTELRAPFAGIVTERLAQRGEYVGAGAAIVHLVDTVRLEARVLAPLALVDLVEPAMQLQVRSGTQQFTAQVRAVVPVGDARSRQFELRLALANNALNVGQSVEVGLPERVAANALVVPRDAIVVRTDGDYLMRVGADGAAERVAVTSLAAQGEFVTIRGPVAAGDVVVVRGVERLRSGQRVEILTREAALGGVPAASKVRASEQAANAG